MKRVNGIWYVKIAGAWRLAKTLSNAILLAGANYAE
jgi:hypothetical protein